MRRQATLLKIGWLATLLLALCLAILPGRPASADSGDASLAVTDFQALSLGNHILVTWADTAPNRSGFNLYRGTDTQATGRPLNNAVIPSSASSTYQWEDFDVQEGTTYYYWLEALNPSGTSNLRGPIGVLHQAPTALVLSDMKSETGATLPLPWVAFSLSAAVGTIAVMRHRLPKRRP